MTETQLRINHLRLQNIGTFREMNITFKPGLNLICGPNGVGKTTVLDVIGSIFIQQYSIQYVRRRADSEKGSVEYSLLHEGRPITGRGEFKNFDPNETSSPYGSGSDVARSALYVSSSRDFGYSRLDGVLRDPSKSSGEYEQEAMHGIQMHNIKQWFSNRFLMEHHSKTWPEYRLKNIAHAKTFFSLLDSNVKLSYVDSSTFEIILDTASGEVPFEYMSAGFRTSYALILGILKEIEFRKMGVAAEDFTGLIMVDELDLHLHPTWHGPMLSALQAAYPRAQLIVSTHSPHMIQSACIDALIVLPKQGCEPRKIDGVDPEYGLIGWTIEEILRDIMGMDDPRPPAFATMMDRYETAITQRDEEAIRVYKEKILRSLHPSSVVRQIIEIDTL